MAEKQNQHFIPRFLLRNFSSSSEKCINSYVKTINEKRYDISISTQCSRKYFYGKDLEIENKLAELETTFSRKLKQIINTSENLTAKDKIAIYSFIGLQIARTVKNIDDIRTNDEYIKKIQNYKVKNECDGTYLFNKVQKTIIEICDLEIKILKNNFKSGFIISDNPIIIYNPYLENLNRQVTLIGTIIILPYSNEHIILLYDKEVYTEDSFKKIGTIEDVDNLNLLQFIFSDKNIYFSNNIKIEKIDEYIKRFDEEYKDTIVKRAHCGEMAMVSTEKKYKKLQLSFIKIRKLNQIYWNLAKEKIKEAFQQTKKERKITLTEDEEKEVHMPMTFTREQRKRDREKEGLDSVLKFVLFGRLRFVGPEGHKEKSILDLNNI